MAMNDPQYLPVGLGALPHCLGSRVKTGAGQSAFTIEHLIFLGNAKPKIVVHGVVEILIQESELFYYGSAHQYGGLADKASFGQPLPIKGFGGVTFDPAIILGDMVSLSVDGSGLGMFLQTSHRLGNGSRKVDVVGVQPPPVFSPSLPPSFVDGRGLAPVFL